MPELIAYLERSLEAVPKWLRGLGLAVNDSKIELCLSHWLDQPQAVIKLFNLEIRSNYTLIVLGVSFNRKQKWSAQVSNAIRKANPALCNIKLIKKYFITLELCTLLTSNFYSILFYISKIWQIPNINPN
jgi:hypothetical protein